MNTIFKYPLQMLGEQTIELPVGARPLTIQAQSAPVPGPQPFLWAEVNDQADTAPFEIFTIGTGQRLSVPRHAVYIATLQLGQYVFHYYGGFR